MILVLLLARLTPPLPDHVWRSGRVVPGEFFCELMTSKVALSLQKHRPGYRFACSAFLERFSQRDRFVFQDFPANLQLLRGLCACFKLALIPPPLSSCTEASKWVFMTLMYLIRWKQCFGILINLGMGFWGWGFFFSWNKSVRRYLNTLISPSIRIIGNPLK